VQVVLLQEERFLVYIIQLISRYNAKSIMKVSNKFSAEITINENTVVKELINVNKDCVTQDWWT